MKKQTNTSSQVETAAKEATKQVKRAAESKELRASTDALRIGFRELQEDEKGLNFKCKRIIDAGLFQAKEPKDLINVVKKYARYRNAENQIVKPLYLFRENGAKYIMFVECDAFSYADIERAICNYNAANSMHNQKKNHSQVVGKWADADGKELDAVMVDALEFEYDADKLTTFDPRPDVQAKVLRARMDKMAEKLAAIGK